MASEHIRTEMRVAVGRTCATGVSGMPTRFLAKRERASACAVEPIPDPGNHLKGRKHAGVNHGVVEDACLKFLTTDPKT